MSNNDFVVKHGLTVLQGGVVINEGGLTVTGGDITLPEILRIGSASGADRFPNTMVSISNTTAVDKPNRLHNTGLLAEGTSDAANPTHYGVGVYGIGYVNDATFAAGVTGEGQISDIMDSGMATGVRGFSVEEHDGINIGVLAMAMAGTANYALYMPAGNIYAGDAQSWELHGALTFSGEYDVTIPQLVGTKTDVTTINNITLTKPSSSATLTIANEKSLTVNNSITFTATDASSIALGAGGTVIYASDKLSALSSTTSAELAGVISDETGTGALVFAESPTLVTPALGVATATSINKVTITEPASSATLTIADSFTTSGAFPVTLTATDTTALTLPVDGTVLSSTSTVFNKVTITAPTGSATLTIADEKSLTVSNSVTFTATDASSIALGAGGTVIYASDKLSALSSTTSAELAGVISDETGTGVLVFSETPTLVTPSVTTSITTGSTSFDLLDTVATTINFGGEATVVNIGSGSPGLTTINHDLQVAGSITFSAGATSLSSTVINVDDPLLYLAANNPADIMDLGILGGYDNGVHLHTGLIRDASDKVWKLISGLSDEPDQILNTVDFTNATYDDLKIGGLLATTVNKVTITAPTNSATITIADGKAITTADSFTTAGAFPITLTATEATTVTLPASGTLDVDGYATSATAAGTTTLTKSSASTRVFTGTATETVILPSTADLYVGKRFTITNNSTGSLSVQDSATTAVLTQTTKTTATYIVSDTATQGWVSWQTSTDTTGNGITDSTGTGTVVMYNESPIIKTSLVTHADSTSFDLINTVATTVNFAGAGTAISIGSNAISTNTYLKNSTVVFGNTNATASAITTPATTFNLINDTATTVNFARAATSITMGAVNSTTNIGGSLAVTGGITVNGGVTLVNTSTVNVADPMIRMASGNTTDAVDIGIVGKYNTTKFTGFVREASDGIWKLFNELVPVDGNGQATDPGNVLDFSQVALGYAPIKVGALTAASFNKVSVTATLNGSTLAIADGKAITTADSFTTAGAFPITLTATASTSVALPTSGTLVADGYTTTATAAGTTVLTASSTSTQVFTGTLAQIVTLPSTSALTIGRRFTIINSSSVALTIQDGATPTPGAVATQVQIPQQLTQWQLL